MVRPFILSDLRRCLILRLAIKQIFCPFIAFSVQWRKIDRHFFQLSGAIIDRAIRYTISILSRMSLINGKNDPVEVPFIQILRLPVAGRHDRNALIQYGAKSRDKIMASTTSVT